MVTFQQALLDRLLIDPSMIDIIDGLSQEKFIVKKYKARFQSILSLYKIRFAASKGKLVSIEEVIKNMEKRLGMSLCI